MLSPSKNKIEFGQMGKTETYFVGVINMIKMVGAQQFIFVSIMLLV